MSDIGDMLREALIADGDYERDASREALEQAVRGYRTRMRTVRWFGLLLVAGPMVFLVAGIWVFLSPSLGDDHRLLGALSILFGLGGSGLGKLWLHSMLNHVMLMRELKITQISVATVSERLDAVLQKSEME